MNRVQAYYAKLKEQPPANIDIQNAWLLYNIGNDRALYPALMRIGGRTDLTVAAARNRAGHLGQLERAPRRRGHGQRQCRSALSTFSTPHRRPSRTI